MKLLRILLVVNVRFGLEVSYAVVSDVAGKTAPRS
jgi:hypothetical protein